MRRPVFFVRINKNADEEPVPPPFPPLEVDIIDIMSTKQRRKKAGGNKILPPYYIQSAEIVNR